MSYSYGLGTEVGYQRVASNTSIAIGDSGKPIAIYGYIIKSGGTAGNVIFANGTSASSTAVFDITGTISVSVAQSLPAAIVFPGGLYLTTDTNTSYCVVAYRQGP